MLGHLYATRVMDGADSSNNINSIVVFDDPTKCVSKGIENILSSISGLHTVIGISMLLDSSNNCMHGAALLHRATEQSTQSICATGKNKKLYNAAMVDLLSKL